MKNDKAPYVVVFVEYLVSFLAYSSTSTVKPDLNSTVHRDVVLISTASLN